MALSARQRSKLFRGVLYALSAVIALFVGFFADWETIGRNFFNVEVMQNMLPEVITIAARNTLVYTFIAFVLAFVLSVVLALMRLSTVVPYRAFAMFYIELFRGLPALITLILVGFGLAIAFQGFDVPGGVLGAASLGLAVVYAAYMAETIRGGIEAVPRGQSEAARSLGMSKNRTMFTIVLPQAFRIMIPPLTNELVVLIKDTSLIFVLGTTPLTKELTKFARDFMISSRNATPLTVAAITYLALTLPLTWLVRRLERRAALSR